MLLTAIVLIAGGYQLLAVIACLAFLRRQGPAASGQGPVSILKPIRGLDPSFRDAIASHMALAGPLADARGSAPISEPRPPGSGQAHYEILAGVRDLRDPAVKILEEFPRVRVIQVTTEKPNGKVGSLMDLAREARNPILIVSDSDIQVDGDYLVRVTAPLADPKVGLVTCLYRPSGATFPARFEGLGISTEFAPSTLVARMVGVDEFAMGSTIALRRSDLDRIGGFEAVADYLADDFQLGHKIHALGLKCVLSDVVVETHMSGSWRDVWRHQVRWARTIRVSNFWGYLGLPITFATVWTCIAAVIGRWDLAFMLFATRMMMATVAGWVTMRSPEVLRLWPVIPLRDLFGAAVWVVGLFGRTVIWRGVRLTILPGGRIR